MKRLYFAILVALSILVIAGIAAGICIGLFTLAAYLSQSKEVATAVVSSTILFVSLVGLIYLTLKEEDYE